MTFIKSVVSGKFLAVRGEGLHNNGTDLIQWDFTGGSEQQWNFEQVSDGVYKIRNAGSGKVIDVPGASHDGGVQLIQWDDHGGNNQLWYSGTLSDRPNSHYFKNVESGLYMDVKGRDGNAGAAIIQYPNFDNKVDQNQQWDFSN